MAKVRIKTPEGDILVRLYDDTPRHRDNFLKLAREGYYDGTLFHRVIKDFMIQGGDPDSRNAPAGKMLGTGGPDYTIPAEIAYPLRYHKRGALSAARLGDEVNPERESSGSQFYIVWGKTFKAQELKQLERQMAMQQEQEVFNALAREHHDEIMTLRRSRDRAGLQALQDKLVELTKENARRWVNPHSPTSRWRPIPPLAVHRSSMVNIRYLARWRKASRWWSAYRTATQPAMTAHAKTSA